MRVLVVNDFLPDNTTDDGQRLVQTLHAIRELGHEVTLIARDGKNQKVLEPTLHKSGIQTYSGDCERLPALSKDVPGFFWSLQEVLAEKKFDVAILVQNFRCGISVPEHYLDFIRTNSPQARILVLNETLYGKFAHERAKITQQLEHHEVAEDWSAREAQAFHRADLVVDRKSVV